MGCAVAVGPRLSVRLVAAVAWEQRFRVRLVLEQFLKQELVEGSFLVMELMEELVASPAARQVVQFE